MNAKLMSWSLNNCMPILKKEESYTCFWLVNIKLKLECAKRIKGPKGKVELAAKILSYYKGSLEFRSIHALIFLLGLMDTSETCIPNRGYSYQIIATRRFYFRVTGKDISDIPMHYVMHSQEPIRRVRCLLESDITTTPLRTPCLSMATWFEEIVKRHNLELQIYELIRNFGINLSVKQGTIWIIKIIS